jgi:hypothetical protein
METTTMQNDTSNEAPKKDDRHEWARVHDLRPGTIVTTDDGVSCVLMDRPVTLDDEDGWGLAAAIIGPPTHPKIGYGTRLRFDDRVKPRTLPTEIQEALHIVPRTPVRDDVVPRTARDQQRFVDDQTTLWALLNNVRQSIGTKEALPLTFSRSAHEALARVLEQTQAVTQQAIETHDVLTAAGVLDAKTLRERVELLLEKQKSVASLEANLTTAREENRCLAEILEDIDTRLAEAFHKATRQTSVSVLESDLAAARKACPDSTGMLSAHAQRYAAIRELSGMALAERHLRNELQVANEETARLHPTRIDLENVKAQLLEIDEALHRAHMKCLGYAPTLDGAVTTEERKRDRFVMFTAILTAARECSDYRNGVATIARERDGALARAESFHTDLEEIRSLLAKDGFHCETLADGVEVALESLREAQKERDADAANCLDRAAAIALLESNGFAEFGSIQNGVQLALDTLRATQTDRDVKAGAYRETHVQLVSAQSTIEKLMAQTHELAMVLVDLGRNTCGRTFAVNTHDGRMNAMAHIVRATDALSRRVDAYAKDLGQHRLKIAAMVTVLDGKGTEFDDADVLRLASLVYLEAEHAAEINAMNAALQDAIKWAGLDLKVTTHIQRRDAIRALARRAEALAAVQDKLAKFGIDPAQHPANAVYILAEQRDTAQSKLAAIRERLDNKPVSSDDYDVDKVARVVRERDAFRATILAVQNGLAGVSFDPTLPPNNGSKSSLVKAVADLVAQRNDLTRRVASTHAALQIANTQLQVANSNLVAALRLAQGDSSSSDVMLSIGKLLAFWRRGTEPYQHAAKALETALGSSYMSLVNEIMKARKADTNETGAILSTTSESDKGGATVKLGVPVTAPIDAMPNIFDCGCSKHKVMAGFCDTYDEFGKLRPAGTRSENWDEHASNELQQ